MAKERFTVYMNPKGNGYWIEEERTAITGDLGTIVPLETVRLFCDAVNALYEINEELPENPKLPLTAKIKELVAKGLKRG